VLDAPVVCEKRSTLSQEKEERAQSGVTKPRKERLAASRSKEEKEKSKFEMMKIIFFSRECQRKSR
jgi:hypothetical protein